MQGVFLLGASGSVGESTLKVLRLFSDSFQLIGLSVHENLNKAKSIIDEFSPKYLIITSKKADQNLLGKKYKSTQIYYGEEEISNLVAEKEVDIVVTAIVGAIGVKPTIAAIKAKKKIAIANKETLVTFGPYIKKLLNQYNVTLVPVDSEHNALFQLLENQNKENIRSIILTASGGSFRELPIEKLKYVTVEETLNHPTWKMGPKITVDSAGLINKGLEVIEAHFLFGYNYDRIKVVIHPESIVHGMVETIDGACLLYASHPDMMFPIAHSLFYPKNSPKLIKERPPADWKQLRFMEPDPVRYPALKLAYQAGNSGGTAPCIFNAANEEAVSLFLSNKISFLEIPEKIDRTLQSISIQNPEELDGYLEADLLARETVRKNH